jgi:predicted 3-demethylubiquinone-9 3-methyltransferase (glyoxalase superfamily)
MLPITPFLWFPPGQAEEAARFYCRIFPDSRVERVVSLPGESPAGPVQVVDFVLRGQPFIGMQCAGGDAFNHAVSFTVYCETQDEIDRFWNALLEGGGHPEACGWLRDRWGVAWQITPRVMPEMMAHPDRRRAKQAVDAMVAMVKFDLAALQAAFDA